MRATTGWVLRMWVKFTLLFALLVGAAWLSLGTASGWFWVVLAAAVLAECYIVRQLAREWSWEARATWWWS